MDTDSRRAGERELTAERAVPLLLLGMPQIVLHALGQNNGPVAFPREYLVEMLRLGKPVRPDRSSILGELCRRRESAAVGYPTSGMQMVRFTLANRYAASTSIMSFRASQS